MVRWRNAVETGQDKKLRRKRTGGFLTGNCHERPRQEAGGGDRPHQVKTRRGIVGTAGSARAAPSRGLGKKSGGRWGAAFRYWAGCRALASIVRSSQY